jgi:hypothetical protein
MERFYPCLVSVSECPVNVKILAPKIESLQMGTRKRSGIVVFSQTARTVLVKFHHFTETISLDKTALSISSRI